MGCRATKNKIVKESLQVQHSLHLSDEHDETQEQLRLLSRVAAIEDLIKTSRTGLKQAIEILHYQAGKIVVSPVTDCTSLFVIQHGEAAMMQRDGKTWRRDRIGMGSVFGEDAMLSGRPIKKTVVAITDLACIMVTRAKYLKLSVAAQKTPKPRRTVGVDRLRKVRRQEPTPKTFEERDLIIASLRANANLQEVTSLSDEQLDAVVDESWKIEVPDGTELVKQGDMSADHCYCIQSGQFQVFQEIEVLGEATGTGIDSVGIFETVDALSTGIAGGRPSLIASTVANTATATASMTATALMSMGGTDSERRLVATLNPGDSFGELGLLLQVPRAATVKAAMDSEVWVIDRYMFHRILLHAAYEQIQEYVLYLSAVDVLGCLMQEEMEEVAKVLEEVHLLIGDDIFRQHDPGDVMFILVEGAVSCTQDGVEVKRLEAQPQAANAVVLGERALLEDSGERVFTVTVISEQAKVLMLPREVLNLVVGSLEEVNKLDIIAGGKREPHLNPKPYRDALRSGPSPKAILRKDLEKVSLLGNGSLGPVELWRHKPTNTCYALKAMSKGYLVNAFLQERALNEKAILQKTDSPYIIKLFETYNGTEFIYFLLEPALGGELRAQYIWKSLHGSEVHARFYSACIILALEHLHERRIVHRDLKPENMLLSANGYIKLIDFGISKFVVGKTFTVCGTPDFLAPEVMRREGHNRGVDWWALGIVLFEMIMGQPPFQATSPMQVFVKAIQGIDVVHYQPDIPEDFRTLVRELLQQDPCDRLPMCLCGVDLLKDHEWYEGFEWDKMVTQSLAPPYKPSIIDDTDTSNFSKMGTPFQHVEYADDHTGWDVEFGR